jgi:hypothetical protein
MITSLLYISRSTLPLPDQARELDAIVEVGRSRNAALNVTGAMIFTGRHFAQILEGSASALSELMTSIRADQRHSHVDMIDVKEVRGGQFTKWSLAYCGVATDVDDRIGSLSDRPAGEAVIAQAKQLRRTMLEMALAGS